MISLDDYLRLIPKTELHCHFASTMSAQTLIEKAEGYGVELPSTDPETLFDYRDLADFLVAFRAAHDVLRTPKDFLDVALEGTRTAVVTGNLRYREVAINPQYFAARGIGYTDVLEPLIRGLRAAQEQYGVGFGVIVAVNRQDSAGSAVELVRDMIANPYPEVLGLGMDDLTPEGQEDPGRFVEAYALARRAGFKLTAHAGETDLAAADAVDVALNQLKVDRIDHGYRIVDTPDLVEQARDRGIPFATTPWSTTVCSGWSLDPDHRIAAMIRAGLTVGFSTDDAVFFRTDIGREFREGLTAMGFGAAEAKRVAFAGIDGAFCPDEVKARLRAEFEAQFLILDAMLED